MVNKDSVRQELGKLLASRVFHARKQACNFLQYVVTEKLEGRGSKITQYGIAIDALGKPTDYCPTENPAVRVEAGRIRKLLEKYYADEGVGSSLQILLPVGNYEPVFKTTDTHPEYVQPVLEVKSIQSVGPRIFISSVNPANLGDNAARNLAYNLRSGLSVALGRIREVRIALADHGQACLQAEDELEYAWHNHRAEFLLKCEIQTQRDGFVVHKALLHTVTGELIWSGSFPLPHLHSPALLENMYACLVQEAFSLNSGTVLAYWSRYWHGQDTMPAHYRVLAEHIHFVQEDVSERSFLTFLQACQERAMRYHDDALAHLHFAIACLYGLMLKVNGCELLGDQWRQATLKALELNPGNALAHGVFALECFHRGDLDLSRVEMDTARQANPHDTACGRLMAVGLCALRGWEHSQRILGKALATEARHPEPFRSIPCLYYFRRGSFITAATEEGDSFRQLGGWETFGKLTRHCQQGDCRSCIQTLGQAVDRVTILTEARQKPANQLWESIRDHLLTCPAP
ncbi:MAG: hypothetical protein KJ914_11820 [Gammaproteobacteria bacterium]|nr:hypothetical protein [Gammaproteobacteria bacterium]MBU1723570.1 hypothetical protein [Gammaproteobacteria bacterium]MBU2004128.1 hypothetical protein [Gammaproteobacteria bacterium]